MSGSRLPEAANTAFETAGAGEAGHTRLADPVGSAVEGTMWTSRPVGSRSCGSARRHRNWSPGPRRPRRVRLRSTPSQSAKPTAPSTCAMDRPGRPDSAIDGRHDEVDLQAPSRTVTLGDHRNLRANERLPRRRALPFGIVCPSRPSRQPGRSAASRGASFRGRGGVCSGSDRPRERVRR